MNLLPTLPIFELGHQAVPKQLRKFAPQRSFDQPNRAISVRISQTQLPVSLLQYRHGFVTLLVNLQKYQRREQGPLELGKFRINQKRYELIF